MTITPMPQEALSAVETGDGRAVLVGPDRKIVEWLQSYCPTCGRQVNSIFDHIAENCKDWPGDDCA